jgi:hypothetical protein
MTQTKPAHANLSIDEMPWLELIDSAPIDLPCDDGAAIESPWHTANEPLLKQEADLRVLRSEETQP